MFNRYNHNTVVAAKDNRLKPTKYENWFWFLVSGSKTGYIFRRQKPIGNFIVDFYCRETKIVIEIDGEYHNENGFVERDLERCKFLESLGLKVIRYKNEEVRNLTTKKIREDMLSVLNAPLGELPKAEGVNKRDLPKAEGVELNCIYVVIGPTASGKSDKAVELALEIGGEVINADSRQVYIGLDVGTAKITVEEMKGVRHHLLSYVEPKYNPLSPLGSSPRGALDSTPSGISSLRDMTEGVYSVSRFVADARVAIDDIISRGKVPIICGGTGMYIYSLIYGLDHNVAPDFKLRQDLNKLSIIELFDKYKAINGEPADNSISNNRPRLIRAIEIFEKNKDKNNKSKKENREPLYNVKYIKIERSKEELCERITIRAEQRLDAIVDEVNKLLAAGVDPNWLSRVGIEYGAILNTTPSAFGSSPGGALNTQNSNFNAPLGELREAVRGLSLGMVRDEIISLIVLRSLQYAKRQNTWNKKYFK